MSGPMIVKITPLDTQAVPEFVAKVEMVGDPTPPPTLPDAKARWEFVGGEAGTSGWYFAWGPFDKPRPLGGLGDLGLIALDPAKSGWKTMDGLGWTFYSGPYDKPFPIFNVPPPDPTDPPSEPPVDPGCHWRFGDGGWVLICGPYDKPRPIGPGGGNGTPPAK